MVALTMRRFAYLFALALTPLAAGCAGDEDLIDTTGQGDSGGDGVTLEADPPDSSVPDSSVPDTGTPVDSGADTTVAPDTFTPPDTFVIPTDTAGFDTASFDVAVLDSFVGPTCTTVADCPGTDLECAKRACVSGRCAIAFVPAGTATAAQTPSDCKRNQCNGTGSIVPAYDPTDLPNDDNECTTESCTTASPTYTPKPVGFPCSKGGALCDGDGKCVSCLSVSDCPAPTGLCQTATCVAGTCGVTTSPSGTKYGPQTVGDCRAVVCDGVGGTTTIYDSTDPDSDSLDCTRGVCRNDDGIYTSQQTMAAGETCSGTLTCRVIELDGPSYTKTVCGECDVDTDCYRTVTTTYGQCEKPACTNHTCSKVNKESGSFCYAGGECFGACNTTGTCICGPSPS